MPSEFTSLGEGCNYDPELFLHSLDLWFPKKGDPDVRAPHRPRVQETPHSPSYTLRIHGGLVLSTLKLCPGAVSPSDPDLARNCQAVGEVRSSRTRLLPPQLGWVGSSGGLEAALGLRGQPSARLQNSSCVHIKASNERKMPFLAPRARSADVVVWQAEWASTVWRSEGRKGRCESDLGPQPLGMDRPANCINKC